MLTAMPKGPTVVVCGPRVAKTPEARALPRSGSRSCRCCARERWAPGFKPRLRLSAVGVASFGTKRVMRGSEYCHVKGTWPVDHGHPLRSVDRVLEAFAAGVRRGCGEEVKGL